MSLEVIFLRLVSIRLICETLIIENLHVASVLVFDMFDWLVMRIVLHNFWLIIIISRIICSDVGINLYNFNIWNILSVLRRR